MRRSRASLSAADRAAWAALRAQLMAFAGVLAPFKADDAAPRSRKGAGNDWSAAGEAGAGRADAGQGGVPRVPADAPDQRGYDVLNDDLTDDRLQGLAGLRCDAGIVAWAALAQFADPAAEPAGGRGAWPARRRWPCRRAGWGPWPRRWRNRPWRRACRSGPVRVVASLILEDDRAVGRPAGRWRGDPCAHWSFRRSIRRPPSCGSSARAIWMRGSSSASRTRNRAGRRRSCIWRLKGAPDFRGADLKIAPRARAVRHGCRGRLQRGEVRRGAEAPGDGDHPALGA